jgi:hypothetical protein
MMDEPLIDNWFGDRWKRNVAVCALLIFAGSGVVSAQSGAPPRGWTLAGDHPQNYITGVDKDVVYQGHASAYLKGKPSATEGFGTLMQQFDAAPYAGKRVRLSAWAKAANVDDWAGLWMRVDRGSTSVAFDNMQNRAIQGTTSWRSYSVVLDVPKDATRIAFGVLVCKTGTVWLNGVQFETVGIDVPVTDMWAGRGSPQPQAGPTNLNFEE